MADVRGAVNTRCAMRSARSLVLASCLVAGGALSRPAAGDAVITIDATAQGAVISPDLFGHNLEVTRRAVWSGLSAQMVANRKFAAVEGNKLKRWQAVGGDAVLTADNTAGYAGARSALITVPAGGQPAGLKQQQEVLAVEKGRKYGFRARVKTDAARSLRMRLTGDAGKTITEKEFQCKPDDWQLLETRFASDVTWIGCQLEITSDEAGSFRVGAVSLLPSDSFHGMRRDVIELLKQLKPGCIRFPGGCYAEFYRWEDGLLPVDQRPPIGPTGLWFLLPNTDDYDTHEIGTDEFIALCREVGAKPAITIRMSEKTPESAAAWVEYCNGSAATAWGKKRAERGQKSAYGVKTWFLGNELYSFGRGGLNNPVHCARQSKLFAEAVRKVDPSAELVGCTDLVYGNLKMGWNTPLLEQAGSLLSSVSCHDYLRDSAKPRDLREYAAAATKHLRPAFEGIRRELRRPVQFDEWNTIWGQTGSLEMGFCVAGVLNLLCREGSELDVRKAFYFQPISEGAITVKPLTAELDTAGLIFDLFNVHQGNRVLAVSNATPVDLCASLSPDRKKICVTLVNSATNGQCLSFQLAGGATAGQRDAEVRYLVARSAQPGEKAMVGREEKVPIVDGTRIDLQLPPCSVTRLTVIVKAVPGSGGDEKVNRTTDN